MIRSETLKLLIYLNLRVKDVMHICYRHIETQMDSVCAVTVIFFLPFLLNRPRRRKLSGSCGLQYLESEPWLQLWPLMSTLSIPFGTFVPISSM